jgi:hypothetical protein
MRSTAQATHFKAVRRRKASGELPSPSLQYKFNSFRAFESGIMLLLLGLSERAKKTFQALGTLVEAFQEYFGNGSHVDGARITRARFDFNAKNDIPVPDIARFELGWLIALLTKIVPTWFWMVYHVHSNPKILQACRDEISKITTNSPSAKG